MNRKGNQYFMKLKLSSIMGRMSLGTEIVSNGRQISLFQVKGFWLRRQGHVPEWGCHDKRT